MIAGEEIAETQTRRRSRCAAAINQILSHFVLCAVCVRECMSTASCSFVRFYTRPKVAADFAKHRGTSQQTSACRMPCWWVTASHASAGTPPSGSGKRRRTLLLGPRIAFDFPHRDPLSHVSPPRRETTTSRSVAKLSSCSPECSLRRP